MMRLAILCFAIGFLFSSCGRDDNEEYGHDRLTGKSATDIVSSNQFKTLIVELQYLPGHQPTERAVGDLREFIESVVDKPEGVHILQQEIEHNHSGSYSLDNIKSLENAKRQYYTSGDTLCTYFVFVNGDYAENSSESTILGIAYQNTSMVLFHKTIEDRTGGIGKPRQDLMESTVLKHEFGHILGLVNVNDDMVHNHQDEDHGNHCDNEDCLMYWTVGSGSFVQDLVGRLEAPDLDQNCLTDLNALK